MVQSSYVPCFLLNKFCYVIKKKTLGINSSYELQRYMIDVHAVMCHIAGTVPFQIFHITSFYCHILTHDINIKASRQRYIRHLRSLSRGFRQKETGCLTQTYLIIHFHLYPAVCLNEERFLTLFSSGLSPTLTNGSRRSLYWVIYGYSTLRKAERKSIAEKWIVGYSQGTYMHASFRLWRFYA